MTLPIHTCFRRHILGQKMTLPIHMCFRRDTLGQKMTLPIHMWFRRCLLTNIFLIFIRHFDQKLEVTLGVEVPTLEKVLVIVSPTIQSVWHWEIKINECDDGEWWLTCGSPYIHPFLPIIPKLSGAGNCSSSKVAVLKKDHRVIQSLQCCARKLAIGWGRNFAGHERCQTNKEGILRLG
jgi:hypothetical protein